MKISQVMVFAAAFLVTGAIAADEVTSADTPIELSAAQMDQITAGTLKLPNGNLVFDNFDNPAPDVDGYVSVAIGEAMGLGAGLCTFFGGAFCHPALTRRSDTVLDATFGKGPFVGGEVTMVRGLPPLRALLSNYAAALLRPASKRSRTKVEMERLRALQFFST